MAKTWRDAYGKNEVVQRIRPAHTDEFLNNPHKGTATFQRFNGDPLNEVLRWDLVGKDQPWVAPPDADKMEAEGVQDWNMPHHADLHNDRYPPSRIAYCRWAWCLLEPEPGKLRFDIIDRALERAAQRNQTLALRTQPQVAHYECPKWYWDLGAKHDPAASNTRWRVADHNDPLYLQHWGNHIRALGERYDGHPNLESFDVAYGGGCGETGGNAECLTARRLVQTYIDSFPTTQLLTMLGTEGCAYAARQPGFHPGWRADCFGDVHTSGGPAVPEGLNWNHMNDMYPTSLAQCGVADAWKTAPTVFESCWTVDYWHQRGWDIDWIIEQGLKYHISSFMPKSAYMPDEWMDKIMSFSQRMGYWFHLQQMMLPLEARAGALCTMTAVIDNKGVAPIYRPYAFALRFSQGDLHKVVRLREDIRRWMPGLTYVSEALRFPAGFSRGETRISCAIVNAANKPIVRLAIKARDSEGWHPLTSMDALG